MSRWLWRASWLLLPIAVVLRFVSPEQHVLLFAVSCLSLMPLAKTMGDATEDLAERLGPGLGSLLNATFGNAAELIVALLALKEGHVALVKGSITGQHPREPAPRRRSGDRGGGHAISRGPVQPDRGGRDGIDALPRRRRAFGPDDPRHDARRPATRALLLSEEIASVLIVMYGLSLLFQLRTQPRVVAATAPRPFLPATPGEAAAAETSEHEGPLPNPWLAVGRLLLAGAATGLAGEILVGSLEGTLHAVHLPETFVGIVIIAIVGNAAEHSSAIAFGNRGEMDVALGIAWESSKQIALLVAPLLVFAGMVLGAPMDLNFSRFEVTAIGLAVLATAFIALDGETHWLEGAFLIAVYAVLAIGFYFVGS